MKNFTLGLDLGSNSVGWAIVNENPSEEDANLITGVRIFPEGTEKTTTGEQSRNLARRQARSMRRQLDRRSRRKRHLVHVLMRAGAIPTDVESFRRWVAMDPYPFRKRGLDEALAPEEFARALVHLNRRRGFKSNLKAQSEEAKDQDSIKGQIAGLQKGIEETGARTLGEYLAGLKEKGEKIRERHTSRAMYEREFDLLWARQAEGRPDVWTDALKELVYPGIFYQRPLKSQAHLIGKCPLEPEERRCARASWFAQQFRLLQTVNDLRILSRTEGETLLPPDKREALIDALMKAKDIKIERVKGKILGLSDIESLNFERTEETKMLGNPVEAGLRKLFKKDFDEKAGWLRETVWEALLEDDPEDFHRKALNEFGLSEEQIAGLFKIPRPSGYFHYSLKAIRNLLPYLEDGCNLHDARINAGYKETEIETSGYLPPVASDAFRNPVVVRALSETRKVVNAIVREYGVPSRIIVELARQTKGTIKSRQEENLKNRQRQRDHERIAGELQALNVPANHDTIEKYKLWEECGGVCPYTGDAIGLHQLYGDFCEFDIEHIIPYSRSFDDGFMNKTLCARRENQRKHNQTPYEAYHGKPQYDEILIRVRRSKMPYYKQKLFSMKEVPDDWSNRQLNDSSYIATAVVDYLRRLGCPVSTTRGQITAELRRQWGLNSILGDDPAVKMRDDHRHHAVDAVAIALTSRSHIQQLRRKWDFNREERFPSPWEAQGVGREAFRQVVKDSIESIRVSHRPQRKVAGQLNKETSYGPTAREGVYSCRVDLRALTPSMAASIADPVVRELVYTRLREHGVEPGAGSKAVSPSVFEQPLYMPSKNGKRGPVIRRVRIRKNLKNLIPIKDRDGKVYRYVEPGSNHHVTIFEYEDDRGRVRRCKEVVTRFEAAQRALRKEPVIRRTHPERSEAKFLMSLSINDMVRVEDGEGKKHLCRVQKMSGGDSEEGIDIYFRLHTAATIESHETEIRLRSLSAEKFKVEKVSVDVLGRIYSAHD